MPTPLPTIVLMPLVRVPEAFDDPGWIFELKLDGFRAVAYVEQGTCRLVSRRGHPSRRFDTLGQLITENLPVGIAIRPG